MPTKKADARHPLFNRLSADTEHTADGTAQHRYRQFEQGETRLHRAERRKTRYQRNEKQPHTANGTEQQPVFTDAARGNVSRCKSAQPECCYADR